MKNPETTSVARPSEPLPDFIKDRFSRTRGGLSELLSLSCTGCGTEVIRYQKDGHGTLLRCYIDRIYFPNDFMHPVNPVIFSNKKGVPNLTCPSCKMLLGFPTVFKPENRLAYRIIKGRLAKKKLK